MKLLKLSVISTLSLFAYFSMSTVLAMSHEPISQGEAAENLGIDIEALRKIFGSAFSPITSPGSSMGAPMGFGASWGQAYLFVGGQNRSEGTDARMGAKMSGAYGGGFGLGNANQLVGLQLDYAVLDSSDGPSGASNLSVKLHRTIPELDIGLAVGAENVMRWGDAKKVARGYYLAASKILYLDSSMIRNRKPLTITLGMGNGRFRNKERNLKDDYRDSFNYFGSIGYSIHPQATAILDITSEVLTAGVSFTPFSHVPLVVNIGAYDLSRQILAKTTLTASAAYSFSF